MPPRASLSAQGRIGHTGGHHLARGPATLLGVDVPPTLRAVKALGGSATGREITEQLIDTGGFSDDELAVTYDTRDKSVLVDRMDWARSYCKLAGALDKSAPGPVRPNSARSCWRRMSNLPTSPVNAPQYWSVTVGRGGRRATARPHVAGDARRAGPWSRMTCPQRTADQPGQHGTRVAARHRTRRRRAPRHPPPAAHLRHDTGREWRPRARRPTAARARRQPHHPRDLHPRQRADDGRGPAGHF